MKLFFKNKRKKEVVEEKESYFLYTSLSDPFEGYITDIISGESIPFYVKKCTSLSKDFWVEDVPLKSLDIVLTKGLVLISKTNGVFLEADDSVGFCEATIKVTERDSGKSTENRLFINRHLETEKILSENVKYEI